MKMKNLLLILLSVSLIGCNNSNNGTNTSSSTTSTNTSQSDSESESQSSTSESESQSETSESESQSSTSESETQSETSPVVVEEYTIIVTSNGHCVVNADYTKAPAGTIVSVEVTVDNGYELDSIKVNEEQITGNTFEMPDEEVIVEVSTKKIVDDEKSYYELPNWKEDQYDISLGGDFLDMAVGRTFMTGCDYTLSYTLGSKLISNPSMEYAISSNEKVFTVEKVSNGTLKVVAKHAGKAMLRLYDSNEVIRYCGVIEVEDKIALKDMEEYLVYDVEYWVNVMSWVDQYNLIFLEGGRYILSGAFSNSPFETVNGTYEYVGESITGKEYMYEFTDQDIKALGFTGFHISMTGTFMYLQEEYGTADIMLPNDRKEELLNEK